MKPAALALVLLLSGALGCVTPELPKVSAEEAFGVTPVAATEPAQPKQPPPLPSKRSLEAWANSYPRAFECASAAKLLVEQEGRAIAWAHAKACASRADFGMLGWLLDNFAPELKSKADGAEVLAQVIANRGGAVGTDVRLVQQKRLPLFELNAALAQPDAFRGRYLLFVGKIQSFKTAKGRREMIVAEYARGSMEAMALTSPVVNHSFQGTGHLGSVSGTGSWSVSEARVSATFEETGQRVFTRIANMDPFLSIDRTFLFLARFDGARVVDEENAAEEVEHHNVALVSLVSYHDVNVGGTLSQ